MRSQTRQTRWLAGLVVAVVAGTVAVPATAAPAQEPEVVEGAEAPEVAEEPVPTEPTATSSTEGPAGTLDTEVYELAVPPAAAEGPGDWSDALGVEGSTRMVGITWDGDPDAELELRTAAPGGEWSEPIDLDGEDRADGDERAGVGPVWLGDGDDDRLQLRVLEGEVREVRVDAMSWRAAPGARATSVDTAATAAGGPPVHRRTAWAPGGWNGWRSGCPAQPVVEDELRFAVVHHTVNANTYGADDVPALLAGMYTFHTATRGWCDIAYNFLVDRFGRVWEGRSGGISLPIQGGHAQGFNRRSVGVALLGQHHPGASPPAVAPTAASLAAVRDLLAWKFTIHGLQPQGQTTIVSTGNARFPAGRSVTLPTIHTHRDNGSTSCPGDHVYNRIPGLRADVAARMASTNSAGTWWPLPTPAAFFGRLLDDAAGRPTANGRVATYANLAVRGGWARDPLAATVVLSGATDSRIGAVHRLYRAAFGRDPDRTGLAYWVGRRDAGMAAATMASVFAGTNEFRTRYDALADPAFLDALYRNVLGRGPDPSGRAYWLERLAAGVPRHQVLAFMADSSENRTRARIQAEVTTVWFVLLARTPNSAERTYWQGRYATGDTGTQMIRYVMAAPEYARRVG